MEKECFDLLWKDASDSASCSNFAINKSHTYGFICATDKGVSLVSFNTAKDWADLLGYPSDVYAILWDMYLKNMKAGDACDVLGIKYIRIW